MMANPTVTIEVQTPDRTRWARVTLSREKTCRDLIKICRQRWSLPRGVDYQLANLTRGTQLLPNESLHSGVVLDGDTLMLQPMPTHGSR
jgi:hypothetical protein